jgi:hypothetical protein
LHLQLLADDAPALWQFASGEQRDPVQRRPSADDVMSISLRAGWNRIVLHLPPGTQPGTGVAPGGWFVTQLDIRTS